MMIQWKLLKNPLNLTLFEIEKVSRQQGKCVDNGMEVC